MKRMVSLCLTLALILTLAACGSPAGQGGSSDPDTAPSTSDTPETPPASQSEDSTPVEDETLEETDDSGNKILIAYFSATNNTEGIANHLESILNADLYEIVPETPYTSDDLNYNDSSSRSSQEMNDPDARPAISGSMDNMEQYDVIFLGYPNEKQTILLFLCWFLILIIAQKVENAMTFPCFFTGLPHINQHIKTECEIGVAFIVFLCYNEQNQKRTVY